MNLLDPVTNFISTIKAVPNCEFSGSLLVKEPVNTVTNVFYFFAGLRLLYEYKQRRIQQGNIKLLILLSFAAGVGSMVHHSIPTDFTLFLGGIPIYLILSTVIFLFAQLIFSLPSGVSLMLAGLYALVLMFASPYLPVQTIPVLRFYLLHTIVFTPLIIISFVKSGKIAFNLLISLGLFWVGMHYFFLDKPICFIIPTGSHMLWHLFSSLSFYFLTRFFLEYYWYKQETINHVQSTLKSPSIASLAR